MNQPYIFSSVKGKITYLLMAFDNSRVEKPMARMVALQQSMPGVKFLLWCNTEMIQSKVCQYLDVSEIPYSVQPYDSSTVEEDKPCIVVYENFSDVKPWIRDAFFPATAQSRQCLLLDTVDEAGSDQGWAKRMTQMRLASGLQLSILGPTDGSAENLAIAGGDVLIDAPWVFLGKHSKALESLIGQQIPAAEIIVLEEKAACEELYHIDLFLTPTGVEQAGKYVVLLGRCMPLAPEFDATAKRLNDCLDRMATRLEKEYPIKVIRNPIPMDANLYAYNNCILEITPKNQRVWLPKYSFDAPEQQRLLDLEKENVSIWQGLGFTPILVSAPFSDITGFKAGLHCITNELRVA